MKNLWLIFTLFFSSCGIEYEKTYEFRIENRLQDQIVEIRPYNQNNTWITSEKNYLANPGEIIIIGSTATSGKSKKATDIYKQDEPVLQFVLYIDSVRCNKNLSARSNWNFSIGNSKSFGIYTLTVDSELLEK